MASVSLGAPESPNVLFEIRSPSNEFYAKIDLNQNQTNVFHRSDRSSSLWFINDSHRYAMLSDSGAELVFLDDGGGTLVSQRKDSERLVTIVNKSGDRKDWLASDLIKRIDCLPVVMSSMTWRQGAQWIATTKLQITTLEGGRFIFDTSSMKMFTAKTPQPLC